MDYLLLAMNITQAILEKMPDYDQRKKQDFYEKKSNLEAEWKKPINERDDDLILNLREDVTLFLNTFYEEIKK